jgi:hypothetical protein
MLQHASSYTGIHHWLQIMGMSLEMECHTPAGFAFMKRTFMSLPLLLVPPWQAEVAALQ